MDVARAEDQLNSLIQKRSRQRSKANFEEEAWKASVRKHNASLRRRRRTEWIEFYSRLASSLRSSAGEYEAKAKALLEEPEQGVGR